jgi:hypothetical protein
MLRARNQFGITFSRFDYFVCVVATCKSIEYPHPIILAVDRFKRGISR